MKTSFEFTTTREFDIKIKVYGFTPHRPAPACSDHDSPAFSDSGDCAEYQDIEAFFVVREWVIDKNTYSWKLSDSTHEIPVPKEVWKAIEEELWDEITEEGERQLEDEYDPDYIAERKRESREER